LKVDVIVTGGPQATHVAKKTTATIPIVMAVDYDPVDAGFIGSLARPGGNITGLSAVNPELSGKRLQLLKETDPQVTRVAVLWNPSEPNAETFLKETQAAALVIGVQLQSLEVRAPRDIEDAVEIAKSAGANALTVLTDAITLYYRTELAELAAKHHLPAIYSERLFVEAGGLMSYGASDRELHRHAAVYVDKILKGAKPADLPVEQPTQFELVINLKTAKALGLTIPSSIMVRADEMIE
jgi:putative ABC transport system substrate-binding protein